MFEISKSNSIFSEMYVKNVFLFLNGSDSVHICTAQSSPNCTQTRTIHHSELRKFDIVLGGTSREMALEIIRNLVIALYLKRKSNIEILRAIPELQLAEAFVQLIIKRSERLEALRNVMVMNDDAL